MEKKTNKNRIVFLVIFLIIALYWGYIQIFGTCPFGIHMDNGPATCTKDKKCVLCGLIFEEHTGHIYEYEPEACDEDAKCLVCGAIKKPTANHTWEKTEFGTYTYCSVCGKIDSNSIKKMNNSSYLTTDEKAKAIAMAHEMVKAELKAPSTASFPWDASAYTITKSGNQYTVKGYVDAQNSFGAKVRSTFEACFTYEMIGTKYKIHKVYTLIY